MSDLQMQVDQLLREFFYRELVKAAEEDVATRQGWKGFSGLRGVLDEALFPSPSFTPKQFNIMWGQFSHRTRVSYVKNLISR